MSWRTFVRSHAHLIAVADFFTTEVWTVRGLIRYFTLFVDGTDCPESDGLRGGLSDGEAFPHYRPTSILGHYGLVDYHGRVTLVPFERARLVVDYHYFTGVEDVQVVDTMGEVIEAVSASGSEVDVTFSHKYDDNVAFSAGASVFVPTDVFELTRGEDTSTWFYLMTVFNTK